MSDTTAVKQSHPKGLWVLAGSEMWERFNFYGMRAMLILFMTKALMFDDTFSSSIYGSYIGFIYLSPLVGGYIADRYWGNKRSIFVGGLVMAAGELILFFCGTVYNSAPDLAHILFYSGLGFMIAGNGFFKPNISSLVGQLYVPDDTRKDAAYTIFYMGINLGGMFGPLVCGFFGQTGNPADFKWAFLIGGVAMLISLVVQKLYHDKYIKSPEGNILGLTPGTAPQVTVVPKPGDHKPVPAPPAAWLNPVFVITSTLLFGAIMIGALILDAKINFLFYLLSASFVFIIVLIFSDKNLTAPEKQRIWVMIIIAVFVVFFWGAYEQTGASLVFFADRQTNLDLRPGYTMPSSYFQSFNSAFIIIFAPILAWLWLKMGKKQPSTPAKMGLGLILLATGYLWIAFGVKDVQNKVSIIWLTGMYLLHTLGELCLSPIGLSLFNKLAPLRFASLLMAVWFLGNAGGNKLAGTLSTLYPEPLVPTEIVNNIKSANNIDIIKKDAEVIEYDGKKVYLVESINYDSIKKDSVYNGVKGDKLQENIALQVQKSSFNKEKKFIGFKISNLFNFFMLFVVMAGLAGLILLLLSRQLKKMMHMNA